MKPKFVDIHTHVQFAAYEKDYQAVIDSALKESIWLVNVGTQKTTSTKAVEIADSYKEGVYATVGLHPIHTEESYHDSKELGDGEAAKAFTSRGEEFDFEYYKKLGSSSRVLAVGECGLDYYRLAEETKQKQKNVFELQIRLSKELDKPLMIHCRNAFLDLIDILRANKGNMLNDYPGIVHFFSGSREDASVLSDMGFYFSFGGVTTFTEDYNEAIKEMGLKRIVLETDAPYVAPVPFRGKRNEPAYIVHTAQALSKTLGVSIETVSEETTNNALKVFKING
jgi:TatD DNase family protein